MPRPFAEVTPAQWGLVTEKGRKWWHVNEGAERWERGTAEQAASIVNRAAAEAARARPRKAKRQSTEPRNADAMPEL
jgi:SLT domain-containing protein